MICDFLTRSRVENLVKHQIKNFINTRLYINKKNIITKVEYQYRLSNFSNFLNTLYKSLCHTYESIVTIIKIKPFLKIL